MAAISYRILHLLQDTVEDWMANVKKMVPADMVPVAVSGGYYSSYQILHLLKDTVEDWMANVKKMVPADMIAVIGG